MYRCSQQDVVLIAVGIGALFSLFFHVGVDEVKQNQDYHSSINQSQGPSAMKAFDWLKEKQFYQVKRPISFFSITWMSV